MKKILLLNFIVLLTFTACLSSNNLNLNKKTNFKQISKELIKPICNKIKPNKILYITDFVNEKNLDNNSELGFLLSNQLKVDVLNARCTKNNVIKAFELAKNLSIGKDGSKIFTRNINKLATNNLINSRQILVGTYIITNNQFIVYLKLLNLKSGNIISTNSVSKNITNEILTLENSSSSNNIYQPFHL